MSTFDRQVERGHWIGLYAAILYAERLRAYLSFPPMAQASPPRIDVVVQEASLIYNEASREAAR